ncbi:hypothetical protein MOQ_008767 [Trypanosoma cruzi marinkellei]|uniref:Uncharacterized protein n=1 Tax=Trypanosoma cruzi marinkellei TaxID=85056 RepID=K2LXX3_TRYCR|nr:hypothetical protein MOQ_008767 [Trypanosoma cruzi marinkellei]
MSTLENCTDALLQQKVVQASNYERLESRLMEMERAKRSLFFGLKEIITDVERRRKDLGELQEESTRLQQQLQQGSVKFSALAAFMGEEQKKSMRLQEALESCATAWTGCPARAAFLFRALQERSAFCRQLTDVVTALKRVRALVEVVQRVDAAKSLLQERLDRLESEAGRLETALQESHKEQENLQEDLRGRKNVAQTDAMRAWRDSQERERHLLTLEVALQGAHLRSSAEEGLNAVYRMALQAALSIADACCDRRDQMAVVLKFKERLCTLGRDEIIAVETRTHILTDVLTKRLVDLNAQRDCVVLQRERALHETSLLRERQETLRGTAITVEHRMEFLQLMHSTLQLFFRRQRARLLQMHRERVEREAALVSARAAHEAFVLARRFRSLQQEAREGFVAEESLVRGTVEGNEMNERRDIDEQATQSFLMACTREKARKEEMERKATVITASLPKSPPKILQRRTTVTKDTNDMHVHSLRPNTPKKTANTRRGRNANAVPHTDKKRPRSHAVLSAATVARRTYPASTQQQQQEDEANDAASDSSLNSLGEFLTLGTRVPLSALKSTARRAPLQPLPTNVVAGSESGKRKDASNKGLTDAAVRRVRINSPLPRPPGSGNALCALSSALSSAFARTGDAAGTHTPKSKNRLEAGKPRPSILVSKDAWGEEKADDVFADVFSF